MQQSLVAVFDNRGDARKAMEELVSCGYPREQVRLSEGDPAGDTRAASAGGAGSDADDHSFGAGIRHFFRDLFGTDRSESAKMYSEAISRGNYVLTLTADSLQEVERAADIVERFGPIDIDEHAPLWSGAGAGQDALRTSSGARQQAQPGSQQLAPEAQHSQQQQGSQQKADPAAVPVIQEGLKAGERQVERSGVRIFQRRTEVEFDFLAPDEEAYFHGHWSSHYAGDGGTYDEYAPAYLYGSTMARSDLYRGRQWDDVEHNLRGDWEARNPNSAWEKVKAAIRHGWERITS